MSVVRLRNEYLDLFLRNMVKYQRSKVKKQVQVWLPNWRLVSKKHLELLQHDFVVHYIRKVVILKFY